MPDKKFLRKPISEQFVHGTPGRVLDANYFYFDTSPRLQKEIAIVCGGYERCAPTFEINRSSYPYHVVKYTLKGQGQLDIHSQHHLLEPGTVSGFLKGVAHHYRADTHHPMEHIFVAFIGSEAVDLFKNSLLASQGVVKVQDHDYVLNIMQTILETGLQKKTCAQAICNYYLKILLLHLASAGDATNITASLSFQTYQRCRRYIDTHFSLLVSIRQVAMACNVNPRYLANLFKQYYAASPYAYVMRLKLNKAATLLLNSDLTVTEIGSRVGFEDPYHFSRNFKQFHGTSPRQYRNLHL